MSTSGRPVPLEWREHKLVPDTKTGDDPPSSRTYFSMVPYQEKLWLFGGFGDAKGRFNDLRTFDTRTKKWALVETKAEGPKPIYLHTSVIHNNQMWVFGGSTGTDTNEFFNLDFTTLAWSRIECTGPVPSPRYGHAAVVNQGQMIVVGGCKQSSLYFKDTYMLNLATKAWRKLGEVPYDLAYHSLLTYNDRVYLYGGYNGVKFGTSLLILDQTTGMWEVVESRGGREPQPRCGCAAQILGKFLYIFGGYTKDGHTNEMYRFDMEARTWETMEAKDKPNSRAYLQASVIGGIMYIFGGYDGSKCVTDFRSVELAPEVLNIAKIFVDDTPAAAAEYAVRHWSKARAGVLEVKEIEAMFANLATHIGSVGARAAPAIPFDITAAEEVKAFGFAYDDIIDTMAQMHSAGQDTKNVPMLVDKLLKAATTGIKPPKYTPPMVTTSPALALPALGRQKSETSNLRQEVATLKEEKDELRLCKICFDGVMNTVIMPCGHLAICGDCAAGLSRKGNTECPICRKKVASHLQIYWT